MTSDGYTAALCGGPRAGEVVGIMDRRPLSFPVPLPAVASPLPGPDLIQECEVHIYTPITVSFFGLPMHFWVARDLHGEAQAKTLAAQIGAHILNPLGRSLLREGRR